MAKQAEDRKTLELPDLPKLPAKRGPKPLGDKPMTAAERKRRSRQNQRQAGFTNGASGRVPAQLNVEVEELLLRRLRRAAEAEGIPMRDILERLLEKLPA
jgi:hypothetical protein